ncbi:MAG: mechanosensitive ion channel [Lentisphaerae bacterium]|nr:mechanosensitive ion channel [Lentisphaerota bacterium]
MINLLQMLEIESETVGKLVATLTLLLLFLMVRFLTCSVVKRRVEDPARFHHYRRIIVNSLTIVTLVLVGRVWIRAFDSLATFLGLASAGLAVAMHDSIANVAGWVFILLRKPFEVGNRIQIGQLKGDVIDLRLFQFSMIEVGNWVDADQSTGRIVHVPNSHVLREPVSNYETGFQYIWHEIPVLITFESNWSLAKELLRKIAADKAEHLSQGAEEQIRRAAMRYLIFFKNLTPIVYTSVRESGVLLTLRYIVKPRARRNSEEAIWEAILEAFAQHDDIALAYPTTRFVGGGGALGANERRSV